MRWQMSKIDLYGAGLLACTDRARPGRFRVPSDHSHADPGLHHGLGGARQLATEHQDPLRLESLLGQLFLETDH